MKSPSSKKKFNLAPYLKNSKASYLRFKKQSTASEPILIKEETVTVPEK
jgi:hypothetical protein